jgi:hypothetical protein
MQRICLTGKSFDDKRDGSMIKARVGRYVQPLQTRKLAQLLRQSGRLFSYKTCV